MKKIVLALVLCGWLLPAAAMAQTDGEDAGAAAPAGESQKAAPSPPPDVYSFVAGEDSGHDTPEKRLARAKAVAEKSRAYQDSVEQLRKMDEAARIKASKMQDTPEAQAEYQKSLLDLQQKQKDLEEQARQEMLRANGGGAP